MHPYAESLLEQLLAIATKARASFTPSERAVLTEALVLLERRRYAAEDAAVCSRIAALQEAHGLASAVP
jgi:hypothetical protein